MSHSQNQADSYYSSNSGTNSTDLENIPPFQAFPAARDSRPRPDTGHAPPQQVPGAASAAYGSSHDYQTGDDERIHQSSHPNSTKDLPQRERQRTATLPPFTPFPSAASDHRYAPPEGARAQQVRPIPPPAYAPETSSSYLPVPPPDAIRGLPPGQPSPYAPPGPLTARPHVCEHCDSGFARAHDLKRHLETHRSERPHKCPNCQRSFSRKDAVSLVTVLTAIYLIMF
ncbi:C2H2-type zinc-finger protein [Rhizoctonia solani AG-3 Rhs1AP]|uniref:C2H2-type zinc-finger protein n=2 Tax=Rhizoctonia solani AG-3 TaxID=1086053 RepID=A0A074S2D6_9AGAM|nr:C2H2-type zinc-finger protein [Rhizoctonia solani AG-3 Rhs1AP]KEP53531.1 C2H2-type zinc-finger protein [Rhizoctonia solani 123E]